MAEETLTLSLTKDNRTAVVFALASGDNSFYLIDCYQSFLGNWFFIFYWLFPVKMIRLTREEFDDLIFTGRQAASQKRSPIKQSSATLLGVSIGRGLYTFLAPIEPIEQGALLWLVFAIAIVVSLRTVHKYWVSRSIILEHTETVQVKLSPKGLTWRTLAAYVLLATLAILSLWFFWIKPNLMTWCLVLLCLLFYSLQSKAAFVPGTYKVSFHQK